MLKQKSKRVPAPLPRHSFRMKAIGTEFEAHGFGLIVAMVAVILVMIVLCIGAITASSGVGWAWGKITHNEPVPLERPPAAS